MKNTQISKAPFWPDTLQEMSFNAHRINFANIQGATAFELLGAPQLPEWDALSNASTLSILTRTKRLFQILGIEVVFKYAYPPSLKYRFIMEYVLFQPITANVINGEKMTIHYEQIFPNHVENLKEECKILLKCWTINISNLLEPETVPANLFINGERTTLDVRQRIMTQLVKNLSINWCGIDIEQVYINWSKKEANVHSQISFMHSKGGKLISRHKAHLYYVWNNMNWELRSADLDWLKEELRLRS